MFDIIRFSPAGTWYYPVHADMEDFERAGTHVRYPDMEIPPGQSRVGGPVIDLPEHTDYPANLFFVAQLDMAEFSKFDKTGLLPQSGYLYFFADEYGENCKVLYADVAAHELVRVVKEHEENFWIGCLIGSVRSDTESFGERYRMEDREDDTPAWDCFAGSEKSKIYGIYTHCQYEEEDIKNITCSNDVLLLQIGEDFTEEGVLSVLIDKNDLIQRNFDRCRSDWGQS